MSGTKHDQGKPPLDLLPYDALVEVAKVLQFGESKYSAGNWAKGIEYRRLISAAYRHLGAYNSGEDYDEESGLLHTAHLACCVLFLISMSKRHPNLDNRWDKNAKSILPFSQGKNPVGGNL